MMSKCTGLNVPSDASYYWRLNPARQLSWPPGDNPGRVRGRRPALASATCSDEDLYEIEQAACHLGRVLRRRIFTANTMATVGRGHRLGVLIPAVPGALRNARQVLPNAAGEKIMELDRQGQIPSRDIVTLKCIGKC